MIEWNEEEIEEGRKAWRAAVPSLDVNHVALLAAMTRAVELAAARGGTMAPEVIASVLDAIDRNGWPIHSEPLRKHIAAQGARNAVLEAERDALKAELARLTPSGQVAEDEKVLLGWITGLDEGAVLRRKAVRRLAAGAQRAITLQQHLDNLRAMKWKCQDGHPIDLAVIVEGATP
jgi:hypothetical protein